MHEAWRLKKKVTLCPYIRDYHAERGNLQEDACIKNIDTAVDSKNAYCGQPSDKEDIHTAIRKSQNGFDGINASVERIRLEYLLNYPVNKITGKFNRNSEAEQKERRKEAVQLLVSSIIKMTNRVYLSMTMYLTSMNFLNHSQSRRNQLMYLSNGKIFLSFSL